MPQYSNRDRNSAFDTVLTMFYGAYKDGASRRGIAFNLSKAEFGELSKKPCTYCGSLELVCKKNHGKSYITKFNGLDRQDNENGYTIENSVPCCSTCNYAKHEMSLTKFRNWIKRLTEFNKGPVA